MNEILLSGPALCSTLPASAFIWPHWTTSVAIFCGVAGWLWWRSLTRYGKTKEHSVDSLAPDERGCLMGMAMFTMIPLTFIVAGFLLAGWGRSTWPWNVAGTVVLVNLVWQFAWVLQDPKR